MDNRSNGTGPSPFRLRISPSCAWWTSPRLLAWKPAKRFLGVALDIYAADLEIRQAFPWSGVLGPGAPGRSGPHRCRRGGPRRFRGHHLSPTYGHRVAVAWKKGVTRPSTVTRGDPSGPPAHSARRGAPADFSSRLHFPDQVSGAWRMPLLPGLGLELGAEWLGWSSNDRQPLDAGANQSLLQMSALEQHWEDTVNLGVSLDYALNDRWTLITGYTRLHTPVPDACYYPVLPDADRHVVSAGFAWAEGPQRVSASVSFSRFEDGDIINNVNPAFNGKYELESSLWGIAYSRTFP
ncbi:MAG: outer membrane protein transport protein [Kiritimatiellia bacterium]